MADAEPTREDVLDWCRANPGHGYTKAGKHFGISAERVKAIVGEPLTTALDPSKKTPVVRVPADPLGDDVELGDLEALQEEILTAIRLRTRYLAKPESVGSRGEQGAAVVLGILLDKQEKVAALARGQDGPLDGDGPDGGEDAAGRVRSALGIDPGREDEG